jgi:hypothetical protein
MSLLLCLAVNNGIQLSRLLDSRNVREAKAAPADGWQEVMDKEMQSIRSYDVYELAARARHRHSQTLRRRVRPRPFASVSPFLEHSGNLPLTCPRW